MSSLPAQERVTVHPHASVASLLISLGLKGQNEDSPALGPNDHQIIGDGLFGHFERRHTSINDGADVRDGLDGADGFQCAASNFHTQSIG
jgi:hypothetical protein